MPTLPARPIEEATWPDAAPHRSTEVVISINCGNSRYHWALHEGASEDFHPTLFWRTAVLSKQEQADDPCTALGRYMPASALEVIFGPGQDVAHNRATAAAYANLRRIPTILVYIVSTNEKHEQGIAFLFRDIPSRLFRLNDHDFFGPKQGAYKDMGVDRLTSLKAASSIYGHPALVFDGGTAMTYTATDIDGKILGGGITPGLAVKFNSLKEKTGDLPHYDAEDVLQTVEECIQSETPLDLFGKNTEGAIKGAVLKETSSLLHSVVKGWIAKVKPSLDSVNSSESDDLYNTDLNVCITGGDAAIIEYLLKPNHSFIVQPDANTPPPPDFVVQKHKHLGHHGIRQLLGDHQIRPEDKSADDKLRDELLGQRVAVDFPKKPDYDGDTIYRGFVLSIVPGESLEDDLYKVEYDDGDREDLDIMQLYESLLLYQQHGEKVTELDDSNKAKQALKRKEAKEAAILLSEKSTTIRKQVEEQKQVAVAAKRAFGAPEESSVPAKKSKTTAPVVSEAEEAHHDAEAADDAGPSVQADAEQEEDAERVTEIEEARNHITRRVAKFFDDELFFGTVSNFTPREETADDVQIDLWTIDYDDGDCEDFEREDLMKYSALYKEHESEDPNPPSG